MLKQLQGKFKSKYKPSRQQMKSWIFLFFMIICAPISGHEDGFGDKT